MNLLKLLNLKLIKNKIQGEGVKYILQLITGSGISQLIVYLSIPILTRLFNEEAFGLLSIYVSTTLILKTLTTLNYELSIVIPRRDKDAINTFTTCLLITFITTIALYLCLFLFKDLIVRTLHLNHFSFFIYLIPISTFFTGIISSFENWNNRKKKFNVIALGNVGKASSMTVIQLITGLSSKLSHIGLIPGHILGLVINVLILTWKSYKKLHKNKRHISLKRMFYLFKIYKNIPIYNTIISVIHSISSEIPILLITKYYGLNAAGIYGLTKKVVTAPTSIITSSVNQVFFNKASKLHNENMTIKSLLLKTYKNLFFIGMAIFSGLFFVSFLLKYIFGNNWTDVGLYCRILIPWFFISFLNNPVSSIVVILNKQKSLMKLDLFLLLFRILIIYLSYIIYNSLTITIISISFIGIIFSLIYLFYFINFSKSKLNNKYG